MISSSWICRITSYNVCYTKLLRGYYKLYSDKDISYIKWSKKDILKVDELNLKEFEIKLVTYINTLIYKDNEESYISLEELEKLVSSDWSYQSISNNFTIELKKESIKTYGIVITSYSIHYTKLYEYR